MIKIETHCHSFGGSECAHATAETLVEEYRAAGYGGAVLTNHLGSRILRDYYRIDDYVKCIDRFFSLYDEFKRIGDKVGFKTFYGAEIRDALGTEYMFYGFDRKFLYDNKLHLKEQKEMFRLADKRGVFMYQTHPFRVGVTVGEARYLHGAEAFNGHFHHDNNNAQAEKFCRDNSLIMMSGTDYHDAGQPIAGGMFIPDDVSDVFALANYVRSGKAKLYCDEAFYRAEREKYLKSLTEK